MWCFNFVLNPGNPKGVTKTLIALSNPDPGAPARSGCVSVGGKASGAPDSETAVLDAWLSHCLTLRLKQSPAPLCASVFPPVKY